MLADSEEEEELPKVMPKKNSMADRMRERMDLQKTGRGGKRDTKQAVLDPLDFEPPPEVRAATDFLEKHCILPPEKNEHYRKLFHKVDDNESGTLDQMELTRALKTLNANLISDNEIDYTVRVLEMMGGAGIAAKNRETGLFEITFEQFAAIAALSEKVAALDKATKFTINDMDFDALETKMLKAKELFHLNDPKGEGEIPLDTIEVILKAGRIAPEHEEDVMTKLEEKGFHTLSFLDFLAYVPLFVDIHDDINSNPTKSEKRSAMQNVMAANMMGKKWAKKKKKK